MRQSVTHSFEKFCNPNSKILILGSMPSNKSREQGFYYAHPQNRFWRILEVLFKTELPTIELQKQFLKAHKIALWDVIAECQIEGSSDASIRQVIPNDITKLLQETEVTTIFTTGKKAYDLYEKYCYPKTQIKAISLLSPSPANAQYRLEDLVENYQIILKYL